jgi:hypothetical protein
MFSAEMTSKGRCHRRDAVGRETIDRIQLQELRTTLSLAYAPLPWLMLSLTLPMIARDQAGWLRSRHERDHRSLAKLFEKVDLSVESSCHGSGDACPALFESFGIKFSDGKPQSSQSFFKLD